MTTPARRIRRTGSRRSFDLRATTLFFALLAVALVVLGLTARAAVSAAERRPVWAAVLCLFGTAAALALWRRRRRHAARRVARRAAAALREGTRTALGALETPSPGIPGPAVPAREAVVGEVVLDETVVVDEAVAGGLVVTGPVVDYDALGPDEFEQAVAALCERDGCSAVEVAGGAGDLGADVLAVAPDGRRVVVQCKRYCATNRVGSEELQRFGGTCYTVHEADVAVFVTTSDFTAPAVEYAEQCGIVCVDGQALRAWSDGTAPEPWACLTTGHRPPSSPSGRGR
ncbi:restriction endonuclease [Streptomyces sp. NPDC015220]|uniref:restriction endonuclease n=1 Tax=Streptomyces sp. NPDC015220 TaxID=3364947 RepID=UPI0036FDA472